jgi:hypothetical protein
MSSSFSEAKKLSATALSQHWRGRDSDWVMWWLVNRVVNSLLVYCRGRSGRSAPVSAAAARWPCAARRRPARLACGRPAPSPLPAGRRGRSGGRAHHEGDRSRRTLSRGGRTASADPRAARRQRRFRPGGMPTVSRGRGGHQHERRRDHVDVGRRAPGSVCTIGKVSASIEDTQKARSCGPGPK